MDPAINYQPADRDLRQASGGGYAFHFAAEYYDRGWSVLPLTGKKPALPSWRAYQSERPGLDQLRSWFAAGKTNVGIVTGSISGLVVVDCDSPADEDYWRRRFSDTPLAVITGSGGRHFYYRYPEGAEIGNRAGIWKRHIDLRANGGYVVAPPSRHPNGIIYRWQHESEYCLDEVPFFDPGWIDDGPQRTPPASQRRISQPRAYIRAIHAVSGQGGHNQTFRAACKLRDAGLTPEEALCELAIWNRTNATPPWSMEELLHKVRSAYQRGEGDRSSAEVRK